MSETSAIPELEPRCGSWVVTSPDGAVSEFFERANAEIAAQCGYRVETAAGYLARINREAATPKNLCDQCGMAIPGAWHFCPPSSPPSASKEQ
jgi:hypothetical protein